jgi:hypothetical protein
MTRRIRIASLIADLGFGGSENRLLSFARTIDRSRFDHVVITLYRREESYEHQVGSLPRRTRNPGSSSLTWARNLAGECFRRSDPITSSGPRRL